MTTLKEFQMKIDNGINKGISQYENGECTQFSQDYISDMMTLGEKRIVLKDNDKVCTIA